MNLPVLFPISRFHLYRLTAIPVLALLLLHFAIYKKLPFQPGYDFQWSSYLILVVTGLVVCQTNCEVYKRFGQRELLELKSAGRVFRQFAIGWLATVGVFSGIYLLLLLTQGGAFDWVEYLGYSAMMLGISSLENAVLMLRDLYGFLQDRKPAPKIPALIDPTVEDGTLLNIPSGKKIWRIAAKELAFIHSANGIVSFQTFDGQKITSDFAALDEVELQLAAAPFFRINRQYLAHRQAIRKIAKAENRKINLTLQTNGNPQEQFTVIVSRYKAKEFMSWFANGDEQ